MIFLLCQKSEAQPIWRSATTATGASTTATVNKPSGVVTGDLLVAAVMFEGGNGATVSIPAGAPGWISIRRTNASGNVGMITYYRVATSSEPANYSWSINKKWNIGISRISFAKNPGPINLSGGRSDLSQTTSVIAPSMATTVPNCLVLAYYTNKSKGTFVPDATTTERYDTPFVDQLPSNMLATFVQAAAGATGAKTATSSISETWAAQQIAIAPCDATVITTQPAGGSFCQGGSFTLSVSATGEAPLTFQWLRNGENTGTDNDTLQTALPGTYKVIVSGRCGTVTSNEVTVVLNQPTTSTATIDACEQYVWNGNTYSQSGSYTAAGFQNFRGCDSSAFLNLTIKPNLQILSQPSPQPICSGSNDTLRVTANIPSSTYQWFSSSDGTSWTSINDGVAYSGSSGNSLICTNATASSSVLQFKVKIINASACLSPLESTPVSLKFKNLWLGNSNTNWDNTLNWSDQTLPGSGCPEVYIMGNRPHQPFISNTTSLNNIRVMDNAVLSVNGRLRISGSITTEGNGKINATSGDIELFGNSGTQLISGSSFTDRKIKNLIISNPSGAGISATANDSLKLTGKFSFGNVNNCQFNTGNNLTLVSDSNGTAAVADITNEGANSGNSITGNVTVERYISQARKWQFLSVPTNTTQTFRQSWMEGANSISENPRPGYGTVITDNRPDWLARGFDAQSPGGPSVKLYNPSTGNYDAIPNTSAGISTNFGYMTFIRGDRTATPSNSVRNRTTLRTTGPLKQGEQPPIPIPDSSFVAIGNPYASTIDMGKIYKPNCENYIWIWDPALTSSYGVGAYQTFFGFEFQGYYYYYPTPGGGSYPFNDAFNQIQSGQAFFVRGGDSSASYVQMRESAKMSDSNRLVMRPGQLPFGILRSNLFSLVNNSPELADGISVFLAAGLNNEAGPDDAVKMRNNGINVSLNNNGKQFAVEGRGSLRERDTFFLNITGLGQGNFEWNVEIQNMNLPGRSAWLVDKFTKSKTRLTLEGFTNYRFSTNTNPASSATDRFMIVFRQPPVKPLEFTRFSGNRTDDRIALSWNVQNENSDWKYEIERSENKNEFILLDENRQQASGKGISEYFFSDNDPLPGINHYRIKAKDALGNTVYSSKISVGEIPEVDFVSISPNPVKGKNIRLYFSGPTAGRYHIELFDNAGSVVSNGNYYLMPNSNEMLIPLARNTAAGTYFLKVSGEAEKNRTALKVIIE